MTHLNDNAIMAERLRKTREGLLDLSRRNRLINCPRSNIRSKRLDFVDELADEVFRMLVEEGRAFSFLADPNANESSMVSTLDNNALQLPPPEETSDLVRAERHIDTKLQTKLSPTKLQSRLLDLYSDAKTSEEEQGVSSLFLAVGFLEWYESDSSNIANYAPLILVPVDLERSTALTKFKLRFRDDELAVNLSLQSKLRQEFGISLPDFPEDGAVLKPSDYYNAIEEAIATQPRWRIHSNEMSLWFFSFSKYLMYRDLDPETWPAEASIVDNEMIRQLFGHDESTSECSLFGDGFHEASDVDDQVASSDMIHVTDADSSQTAVIEEVRRGKSLVVQGPPGTGKSQTITNILASAVADGKKVLFVCEKMAALEVVKGRLEEIGLGAMCIELHSHKANKKEILKELDETLQKTRPRVISFSQERQSLQMFREHLNAHAKVMNSPVANSELTPFQILGHLVKTNAEGIRGAAFVLPGVLEWTSVEYRTRVHQLEELASALQDSGPLSSHPWSGIRLSSPLLSSDKERIRTTIEGLHESILTIQQCSFEITKIANIRIPSDAHQQYHEKLLPLWGVLCEAPDEMDRQAIVLDVWNLKLKEISDIVELGLRLQSKLLKLTEQFTEEAWTFDLNAARRSLVGHGRSWFRFLNRDYRKALSTLSGVLKVDLPPSFEVRRELLDDMIAAQKGHKAFASDLSTLAQDAFGRLWNGIESDFEVMKKIVNWVSASKKARVHERYREIAAGLRNRQELRTQVQQLQNHLECLPAYLADLQRMLQPEVKHVAGNPNSNQISLLGLKHTLLAWKDNLERLPQWVNINMRLNALETAGMASIRKCLESGDVSQSDIVRQFCHAYHEGLLRQVYAEYPELAQFDGLSQSQRIDNFRSLDLRCIENSRMEVSAAHLSGVHVDMPTKQLAIIKREIEKKIRHIPIRRLLKDAGQAVQAIKPVFMMSPISIAQYLVPGVLKFDLLVMDEASQITPEDALGALARAKQIVVVGDSQQLPPTSFFRKSAEDDGDGDDAEDRTSDIESILGMCRVSGLPERMLRWHYRSQHESLIAVSNKEFYQSRLFIVPSPSKSHGQLGLRFRHVPEGRFGKGTSTSNVIEARAVALAVMEHARSTPSKSLGVGAFSVSQRDAIRDELELLRRTEPSVESFFAASGPSEFFIKNLENIQGDERDVIFISVGYAKPDNGGQLSMFFGPLSKEGGERRLNVLITRAKECCEVFSSITHDDIDLSRAKSRGVSAFKTFLRYAATGILETIEETGLDFDSEFEQEVHRAVTQLGFTVHTQIGTAGFRIDLAVVDPAQPGRYLLGIECDGATYHSSRSARDRDRIRQTVLESRGWKIHRIWSTDWFHQPEAQLKKVMEAIELAKSSS